MVVKYLILNIVFIYNEINVIPLCPLLQKLPLIQYIYRVEIAFGKQMAKSPAKIDGFEIRFEIANAQIKLYICTDEQNRKKCQIFCIHEKIACINSRYFNKMILDHSPFNSANYNSIWNAFYVGP